MTVRAEQTSQVGDQLRQWRQRRRVSQLALSSDTGISTRHLSFVETGRARPSSQLILRIADHLDVPPRDQNRLLLAGGFAPVHSEHDLASEAHAETRAAIQEVLAAHDPWPAVAVDRLWNIVDVNEGASLFTSLATDQSLLAPPVNALRLTLDPHGLAPHVVNYAQWRDSVLHALERSAVARLDSEMLDLHGELSRLPMPTPRTTPPATAPPSRVHVPFILDVDGTRLTFLAIIATFGTAVDITAAEIAMETFLPADPQTAARLHELAAARKRDQAQGSTPG